MRHCVYKFPRQKKESVAPKVFTFSAKLNLLSAEAPQVAISIPADHSETLGQDQSNHELVGAKVNGEVIRIGSPFNSREVESLLDQVEKVSST